MTVGIIVALPEELQTLTSQRLQPLESILLNTHYRVILSGIGAHNTHKAAKKLITLGATKLISWGCAGALAPTLQAGELIIPKKIDHFAVHPQWHLAIVRLLHKDFKLQQGKLTHSYKILSLANEKQQRYQETQAIAVDMESISIAKMAAEQNIPFIALRTIVDPANFNIPAAINKHTDLATGQINTLKLLAYLSCHINEIPALIRLGYHFYLAKKTLTKLSQSLPAISTLI